MPVVVVPQAIVFGLPGMTNSGYGIEVEDEDVKLGSIVDVILVGSVVVPDILLFLLALVSFSRCCFVLLRVARGLRS